MLREASSPAGDLSNNLVDILFHAVFVAIQDAPSQPFLGCHLQRWIAGCLFLARVEIARLEKFDKALQGVRPAVEDQVVSQLALPERNLSIGGDLRRVDDRHIQTVLHGMVEHHAVQHRASGGVQPE